MMGCIRRLQQQCHDLSIDGLTETVLNVECADALGVLIEELCDPPANLAVL